MEILIIVLVVVVVLVGAVAGGVAVTRRNRPRPVPRAARHPVPPARRPEAPGEAPPGEAPRGGVGVLEAEEQVLEPEQQVLKDDLLDLEVLEEPVEVLEAAPVDELAPLTKPSFRERLGKARGLLAGYLVGIRSRGIDEETWEELEEALIRADVGVEETTRLLDVLRARARADAIDEPDALVEALKAELKDQFTGLDRSLRFEPDTTNVWLFVGVNGVGKTTTNRKVGRQQRELGRSCLLAAGDTFRAAAAEQLEAWAERSGADFVRGSEGADPSAVVFDGIQRAAARGTDLVLADTAGRLHTKTNLMDELRKVRRVADRDPGNVTEVLLVLDAVTGQNGLAQAKEFTEAVEVTGVVLTKLDGSAKGGIVLAIESRFGIPVKLVGLGEQVGDLVEFDPDEFVDALFAA
jgi:fused signal recognition particle receptor